MPLRRLNPKRLPGEALSDYIGPKLDDFSAEPQKEPAKKFTWNELTNLNQHEIRKLAESLGIDSTGLTYVELRDKILEIEKPQVEPYHYTKPEYRLDLELKKRGFRKFKGYNIADFMYERRTGWGKEIHQKAWISKKPEMTPAGQPTYWEAYWSENPQSSGGLRPERTLDLAIDDLLEAIDKWSTANRYPTP